MQDDLTLCNEHMCTLIKLSLTLFGTISGRGSSQIHTPHSHVPRLEQVSMVTGTTLHGIIYDMN